MAPTTQPTPERISEGSSQAAEDFRQFQIAPWECIIDEMDGFRVEISGPDFVEKHFPRRNDHLDPSIATFIATHKPGPLWHEIPRIPAVVDRLYDPFMKLLNLILRDFELAMKTRVWNLSGAPMEHILDVNPKLKSKPDILITGPSPVITKDPDLGAIPRFDTLKAPIEIKLDRCLLESTDMAQVASYAREVFAQQHNRRFVHTVILTQSRIRAYKFDRCGAEYSAWINIHEQPELFIRIILGVCSKDERSLGYDTTVQWKKNRRTLTMQPDWVVDSAPRELNFTLVKTKPVFS